MGDNPKEVWTMGDVKEYIERIREYTCNNYKGMFREAGGSLKYPFLTPGSEQYADVLWDWDAWTSNVALRQILEENASEEEKRAALEYERGCVLNFLNYGGMNGWMPVALGRDKANRDDLMKELGNVYSKNMHKPCLAQHAAFITKCDGGNAEWLRENEGFYFMQAFVNAYYNHYRHKPTGLHRWANEGGVGVDNDPCSYYRPFYSCGSIYLNCMMYKEYEAIIYLARQLNFPEIAALYEKDQKKLYESIQEHCWDPKDGFFYSVDLNILPYEVPDTPWSKHPGGPRRWECLIQRIGVWSGFLAMWAKIATPEQAKRMVEENYKDERTFNSPYGVRTLSKLEKMYDVRATGNPSSWLGPIWGISNYFVFHGLVNYGFDEDARELAEKTIRLFGRDLERFGALHEYYEPDNGEPVLNPGFQNWNMLVMNMIAWLEGKKVIREF